MINRQRIKQLNDLPDNQSGEYVLYWMQASQRAEYNHALEYAILLGNHFKKPILVNFSFIADFPQANLRHFKFMIDGLKETFSKLRRRGMGVICKVGNPVDSVIELCEDAVCLITDRGYLNVQRDWRKRISAAITCRATQVESDVVVPVEIASFKEEYTAGTFRPRISRHIDEFLVPLEEQNVEIRSPIELIPNLDSLLNKIPLDRSVNPSLEYIGGISRAKSFLKDFIENKLSDYENRSNDPNANCISELSTYLHFGQISPLQIALEVQQSGIDSRVFLEQLIIRRELSINFCYYNRSYDQFDSILPEWAEKTLETHSSDPREYVYSLKEFENTQTHQKYWNAAQIQMVTTGKMHNYMRMYWAKKILEWSENPQKAYEIALYLNNKYELDGRDPNGYAGVAWCFGKHDRAWKERPVFGKVRYMNANGLRRKFDIEKYAEKFSRDIV